MSKYIKWIDNTDICVADIRGWNEITSTGIANYYKNGKMYATLQKFISREGDTEITEDEFKNYLNNKINI